MKKCVADSRLEKLVQLVETFDAEQPAQADESPGYERHQVAEQDEQAVALHHARAQKHHGPRRDRVGEWNRQREQEQQPARGDAEADQVHHPRPALKETHPRLDAFFHRAGEPDATVENPGQPCGRDALSQHKCRQPRLLSGGDADADEEDREAKPLSTRAIILIGLSLVAGFALLMVVSRPG